MDQNHLQRLPSLPPGKHWLPVHRGESGDTVYRRSDGVAYAKLSRGADVTALDDERRRTEWLGRTGIPCPSVLDWTADARGGCLVTGALRGVPAGDLSAADLSAAWPALAEQLRALHCLPVADCPFDRGLAGMFARAEDVVARGAVNPDFLDPADRKTPPAEMLRNLRRDLPEMLVREPGGRVVCHGDACLPNFLIDPDTLRCCGVIDLGRLGVADRFADLALILASARESWTSTAEARAAYARLFEIHAIPTPDEERLAFYLRLDPLTWG